MDNQKGIIVGTLIGSAVGAAVAVLTTPKSGPELRSEINDQFEYGKMKAEEVSDLLKDRIDSFTTILDDRSSNLSETVIDEANHIVSEAKAALEELREKEEIDTNEIRTLVKRLMKEEMKSGKEIGDAVKGEIENFQQDFKKELDELAKKIS
ncbi:YtxH domain-containing protein [Anaerobacillus alkaliphilus]|uniref:YtxH domain-containing protein n=1 Tax=Anaerobacillus alkaliphilus TaxID=1548597 RepID=A0A4Q0VWV1_9BACI|nr:YtxH domain-containing protein [Anaerobacillus alkaliphilus]RXJ04124.1 YtxH domain-containing protein [Anaerobacillus alkaliphilus]